MGDVVQIGLRLGICLFSVDTIVATNAEKSPGENDQIRDRVSHQLTYNKSAVVQSPKRLPPKRLLYLSIVYYSPIEACTSPLCHDSEAAYFSDCDSSQFSKVNSVLQYSNHPNFHT